MLWVDSFLLAVLAKIIVWIDCTLESHSLDRVLATGITLDALMDLTILVSLLGIQVLLEHVPETVSAVFTDLLLHDLMHL